MQELLCLKQTVKESILACFIFSFFVLCSTKRTGSPFQTYPGKPEAQGNREDLFQRSSLDCFVILSACSRQFVICLFVFFTMFRPLDSLDLPFFLLFRVSYLFYQSPFHALPLTFIPSLCSALPHDFPAVMLEVPIGHWQL